MKLTCEKCGSTRYTNGKGEKTYTCRKCTPKKIGYMSRSARLSEVASQCESAVDKLEDIQQQIEQLNKQGEDKRDEEQIQELVRDAQSIVEDIDVGEIDNLADEMRSWADGMSGTNLENSDKYSRIEEAADTLESIDHDISSIEDADDIQTAIDELTNLADECNQGIDFPGMYG